MIPAPALPETVIDAARPGRGAWGEVWRARELLLVLAGRDLRVRYKQTAVGLAWSVLRPLATMLVFTFVFQRVAGLRAGGEAPYAVLVYAALLPWQFFATALSDTSNALVGSAALITKVYFPRALIPLSAVLVSLVDTLIAAAVLIGVMLALGTPLGPRLLLLPALLLPALFAALGLGLGLGALNVRYRDVRHLVPLLTQFSLYLSPVGYSSAVVPAAWRGMYDLNPLVGVIDGFRWAVLGTPSSTLWPSLPVAVGVGLLCLGWGMWQFGRMERSFADEI